MRPSIFSWGRAGTKRPRTNVHRGMHSYPERKRPEKQGEGYDPLPPTPASRATKSSEFLTSRKVRTTTEDDDGAEREEEEGGGGGTCVANAPSRSVSRITPT